jgi:hypothetical protein
LRENDPTRASSVPCLDDSKMVGTPRSRRKGTLHNAAIPSSSRPLCHARARVTPPDRPAHSTARSLRAFSPVSASVVPELPAATRPRRATARSFARADMRAWWSVDMDVADEACAPRRGAAFDAAGGTRHGAARATAPAAAACSIFPSSSSRRRRCCHRRAVRPAHRRRGKAQPLLHQQRAATRRRPDAQT